MGRKDPFWARAGSCQQWAGPGPVGAQKILAFPPAPIGRELEGKHAKTHRCLPAIEGIVARNDVGAVLAGQELDAVVEGLHSRPVRLALLNDVQGIP